MTQIPNYIKELVSSVIMFFLFLWFLKMQLASWNEKHDRKMQEIEKQKLRKNTNSKAIY